MTDQELLRTAAQTLPPHLLVVWLQKHIQGIGRRHGSKFLEITEDAWRHRLQQAERELAQAIEQRKDAA